MTVKRSLGLASVMCVAGASGWMWFGQLSQEDLTKRAKRVTSVMGMGGIRPYELPWAWISNREILIFHNDNIIMAGAKPSSSLRLTAVDVTNQRTRPLPLVQKRLANLNS